MRTRMARVARLSIFALGGLAALSLRRGQALAPRQAPPAGPTTVTTAAPAPAAPAPRPRDFSQLPDLQKHMCLGAQRGAEWLFKMNAPDGRFVYGYLPALKRPME